MSRILLAPMEGLADDLLRGVLTAHRRLRLGDLRIHPRLGQRAAGQDLPAHLPGTAERQPHRRRHADARAVARFRPVFHGRERASSGDAEAGRDRPQLRLPGADGQSPSRRRGAAGRAGIAPRRSPAPCARSFRSTCLLRQKCASASTTPASPSSARRRWRPAVSTN